ncbi:MAG: hypothetical protein HY753_03915 [Nitrospirae bacterium]|nr:hypothetical protein [Nitrospirota bacterium]
MEKTADELKEAFDSVSPYIQKHTSQVCPSCPKVCCIDRHGRYEENDLIFIAAMRLDNLNCESDRPDTDPCRFLSEKGCSLPRYRRPFRCTWYFCEKLLDSMKDDGAREYKSFISALQKLQGLRQKLLEMNSV